MTDRLTPERRSWNMSRIKGKNTAPEVRLRSLLHQAGFRFRIHRKDLPGAPDIVLPRYKTVIFVHGCFWHRHQGCRNTSVPKTRQEFWQDKFSRNVRRDEVNCRLLEESGWRVIIVWECDIERNADGVIGNVVNILNNCI